MRRPLPFPALPTDFREKLGQSAALRGDHVHGKRENRRIISPSRRLLPE
jgi:hypothetical protein